MSVCEEQVARLDQMQASGGTAAVAPMPAFFTVSLCPDSVCLFVSVGVCAHTYPDVGRLKSISYFGMATLQR